jgi:hypothetical protein
VKTSFVTISALALLALSGCAKEDTNSGGTTAARDAAPGSLSETSPPSAPSDDRTQDAPPAGEKDDRPVNEPR